MNQSITVTIITVCYNSENSIKTTLENIKNLKTKNSIEYIVIDGNSSDGTKKIISEYEMYIDYYVSELDDGIYDAMNKGIRKASGYIIGFLNCGDYYDDNTLENVIDTFSKTDADIVYGNVTAIHNLRKVGIKTICEDPSYILEGMIACHQGVFVKTEVQKEHEFDTRYKIVADRKMLIDLYLQNYKFVMINENLAYYDDMGVSSIKIDSLRRENNLLTYSTYLKMPDLYLGTRRKAIDSVILNVFFWSITENKYEIDNVAKYFAKVIDMKSKVFIWGAGKYGETAEKLFLDMGYEIAGYLDTNPSIKEKGKFQVMSPTKLEKDDRTVIVISSIKYSDEIIECIKKQSNLVDIPFWVFHKILIEYEKQSYNFKIFQTELAKDEYSMALQHSSSRDL
ncbi:glycosyltransferase [Butyrivibrio sp. WCE2006]|uniref:glycosyltransferase n=1 Tax=Butyrivibrio sp. WCE2006 TaxID=1410611 RepID=UPI00067883E6|nr:glycosyltransferase [Butyrivibrio sp. WCE2006]